MAKNFRPCREVEEIISRADLAIWDKKSSKELDLKVIDLILDLIIRTKTEEEFIAAIEVIRFANIIDEYLAENKNSESVFEFYHQHKKILDKDKNKAIVFYKKFGIKIPINFKSDYKKKYDYPDIFYDEELRKEIIKEQDYKCKLCEKKIEKDWAHLHHINYNKRNCEKENLALLCPRCHGKTNSNRVFWQNLLEEKKRTEKS